MTRGRPKRLDDANTVTRSFNLPKALYTELQRIAGKERRDVTSQLTLVLETFVSEYRRRENEPGKLMPARKAA